MDPFIGSLLINPMVDPTPGNDLVSVEALARCVCRRAEREASLHGAKVNVVDLPPAVVQVRHALIAEEVLEPVSPSRPLPVMAWLKICGP